MKLLVGLGNPGRQYAGNRHNIGFMAVDAIADAAGMGPWRARFQGEVAEGRIGTEKVVLLKPATFMNDSGQSVGEAMRYLRLDPADVTVFHDELDLAPGKVRLKTGGGHAGHNGLRSIHQHVGEAYHRVRLGIGHPGRKELVSGYVLHDFAKADEAWLGALIDEIGRSADRLIAGDGPGFMNRLALAVSPPDPLADDPPPRPKRKAPATAGPEAPGPDTPRPEMPSSETPQPEDGSPLDRLRRHFSND